MQTIVKELLPIFTETLYEDVNKNVDTDLKGNGSNGLLIIVAENDFEKEQEELLQKMILACKLNIEDCHVLKIAEGINPLSVFEIKNYQTILSFGKSLHNDLIQFPNTAYTIFKLGSVQIVFSHSLKDLQTQTQNRTALWTCLKIIFKL
jgi:DNA polymerase III psi subunit